MSTHSPSGGDTPSPDFSDGKLVAVVAQDAESGEVLMVAWMNEEAYRETLATSRATYYSRSRGRLWRKGEESGHVQRVREVRIDCDADAILLLVDQTGPACHEGYRSCFFRRVDSQGVSIIAERLRDPSEIYRKS
jgi:phosphoribosyl-AMP cyclohydrolase